MPEEIHIPSTTDREAKYSAILPQVKALIADESDIMANLANMAAVIKQTFHFFWVGFYLVKGRELVLGPFQGPVACTRISFGKGVCGNAWETAETIIVPDVDQFPGHIACSSQSRSEIVVPVFSGGEVIGVLDIDSDQINDFSSIDQKYLEQLVDLINFGQ